MKKLLGKVENAEQDWNPKKLVMFEEKGSLLIESEFLGSDFGSLAKVLNEGRMQVVGFGQKLK